MGFMDALKNLTKPYDDDEDFVEEVAAAPRPVAQESALKNEFQADSQLGFAERAPTRASYYSEFTQKTAPTQGRDNKVVNIHTTTQVQVVLVKPERFENAAEIADHLREKRTVVMNLEKTQKDIARRLIDFLSGVAYAQEGKIKKVAVSTYIITPYNVDIMGDLIDELENNGLYF